MVAHASESIDQRFAQLIKQFGLTKNSFAISLGKTASVVQHLIEGRNKPGYDLLCKVFEIYPNVSRDWLLLGRGPMLVGGEPAVKAAPRPSVPAAPEPPLEPIDLSDVEAHSTRRAGPGVAGTRLQPAEIAATIALATAAQQPARAAAPAPAHAPSLNGLTHAAQPAPFSTPAATFTAAAPKAAPAPPRFQPAKAAAPTPASLPPAPAAPAPVVAPLPVAAVAPPTPIPAPNPEAYISSALHAQHLQHQLAMAEMRNQHLLEQQQMLREMLAMARQAMV